MSDPEPRSGIRAQVSVGGTVRRISKEEATTLIRAALAASSTAPAQETIVWMDVSNPAQEEGAFLRDAVGFHPLAVEDCLRGRQRPKVDRYPGYFFLVAYAAAVNRDRDRIALKEFHLFLGAGFLVTVHDHRVEEVTEIMARWRALPERFADAGAIAHVLLDAIVDDYFPAIEHFAERTERIERSVFEGTPVAMPDILLLRHELALLRRVVAPLRDVLSTLLRRDLPFLRPEMGFYFQDVHDHTIRVTEEIDVLRELLSSLLDAQLSASANLLNQTMRMMTAWSIILMSMTLVAGVYGMNFVFMPELEWRWGYAGALALMLGIGTALITYFRRRGWL
jgi:magnesium transporter